MSSHLTPLCLEKIRSTLATLETLADLMQADLNIQTSSISPPVGPLLALSRDVDTLERICLDLSHMLNPPAHQQLSPLDPS